MRYTLKSEIPILEDKAKKYKVNIFLQFFIHENISRQNELLYSLSKNIQNEDIDRIILLNERIYSNFEMNYLDHPKVTQVNINKRLEYSDVINYVYNNNIEGYICIINSDIYFDNTINNLHKTNIDSEKYIFAQLRYNLKNENIEIYGPRSDSQDTWIYHSNHNSFLYKYRRVLNIQLGKPGCDNKITYLFNILGFNLINYPELIKTIHVHSTEIRNYTKDDTIKEPYLYVIPHFISDELSKKHLSVYDPHFEFLRTNKISFNNNIDIYNYIKSKIDNKKKFIIPRIAGIENNFSVLARVYNLNKNNPGSEDLLNRFIQEHMIRVMKNNAGIKITSINSAIQYSDLYLNAFDNCDMYFTWEKNGGVYRGIHFSQDYIETNICKNNKQVWAFCLDIFHYIHNNIVWTHSLKGKRILLVSAFEESLKKQIPNRDKIYGIDLFPECTFITIKPPQTQGEQQSEDFFLELQKFYKNLDKIKKNYDVALVSSGGYGNLICNYIYEKHKKSAIYVGGVLQMYFGILGNRWLEERKDIVNMYLNTHWTRPMDSEKPSNHKNIEKGCYW